MKISQLPNYIQEKLPRVIREPQDKDAAIAVIKYRDDGTFDEVLVENWSGALDVYNGRLCVTVLAYPDYQNRTGTQREGLWMTFLGGHKT
ncbi:hypothetical protein C4564_05765 [Candidatus Microgenomates bacterium]|nr:MAG: hypothetical protein C4564_05765 [Candidatus Microgenomates bacterium]